MTIEVIKPRKQPVDPVRMKREIDNALTGAALGAQTDFDVTTQTWNTSVNFSITSRPGERIVETDDRIYSYVNNGTPAHIIVAKRAKRLAFRVGGRAKTRPGSISSRNGSKGKTQVWPKIVNHPGTEPRKFDEVISKKWDKRLKQSVRQAIKDATA